MMASTPLADVPRWPNFRWPNFPMAQLLSHHAPQKARQTPKANQALNRLTRVTRPIRATKKKTPTRPILTQRPSRHPVATHQQGQRDPPDIPDPSQPPNLSKRPNRSISPTDPLCLQLAHCYATFLCSWDVEI